jgi:hypothetical protein
MQRHERLTKPPFIIADDAVAALLYLLGVYRAERNRIRGADASGFDQHATALDQLIATVETGAIAGLAGLDMESDGEDWSGVISLLSADEAEALQWLLNGAPWEDGALTEPERLGATKLRQELLH